MDTSTSSPYPLRTDPAASGERGPSTGSGRAGSGRSALLREPLFHFAVLGALLFGIDHFAASRKDDPHTIVVDAAVDQASARMFREAKGREPSEADQKILRQRWIDNEVLYREGLALRVDQGDPTIRERVIFKSLNVIEASLTLPKIDEAGLRAYFDEHKAKYGEPARLDFLEAVLASDANDEAVAGFVAALNGGAQSSDAKSGLRVYKGRPRDNVVQAFGPEFTTALEQSPLGTWRAIKSPEGLRVVRLDAVQAARPLAFEQVRGEVLQDWKDAELIALRTKAVRDVSKKYTVQLAGAGK